MKILEIKKKQRTRRKLHIRKRIKGTTERPRLTVFKSLNHMYAQIIDDTLGVTIVSASTLDSDVKSELKPGLKKSDESKLVGMAIARKAIEKDIKTVAFDRKIGRAHV